MAILPGFGGFRYPSKLLVGVNLAVAGLAGFGWDRVALGRGRRAEVGALVVLGVSLVATVGVAVGRGPILRALNASSLGGGGTRFGPFDPPGIWVDLLRSTAHGATGALVAWGLLRLARRRAGSVWPGALAVLVVAVDLAVTNAGVIFAVAQADFDRRGVAAAVLERVEAATPGLGPGRIYRMDSWAPLAWDRRASPTRLRELALWEQDTLLPNFGTLAGIEAIRTSSGAVEAADFAAFFKPYTQQIDAQVAAGIGGQPGQDVFCYPRAAFDLWNTRYFLLPIDPADWRQENRALISFLDRTEQVYPRAGLAPDRNPPDFQIRRNLAAFPRAWTVHDFLALDPAAGKGAAATVREVGRHLARGASARGIPPDLAIDPRVTALVETTTPAALAPFRSPASPTPAEAPRIVAAGPSRVELAVTLTRPGLVVLADRFDPGWTATVDEQPAPVLRANRLMRAVAVGAGSHRIVYRYEPWSFRVGAAVSIFSLVALGLTGIGALRSRSLVKP